MRSGAKCAFVALVGLSLVACRAKAPGSTGSGQAAFVSGGSGSARIAYQPAARVVERDRALAMLGAVSTDGWMLALDAAAPELRDLRAGDVLVFKYLLARRVVAADTEGAFVYVLTESAQLGDVVRQGHIEFDAPIRFGSRMADAARLRPLDWLADALVPPAYAQEPVQQGYDPDPFKKARQKGELKAAKEMAQSVFTKGWKTTFSATPSANRIDLALTMTKELAGMKAVINGAGYLTDFDMSSKIDVEQGVVERLEAMSKRMNGVMNFSWEAGTETPGAHTGDDRIKLPSPIKIPLAEFVGGLPLFLEIGGALIIKPAFSGGSEISKGAFRVTYDGYQHFSAKEGNIDSDGNVKGDIEFVSSQNISPLAPHGFVLAVAAPRVELKLGMESVLEGWDPIKKAAERVDKIEETLLKKLLTPEQYEAFEQSPLAGLKIGKVITDIVKSDADAFIEVVTSSGMSFSGISVMIPCTRTDIHLLVKVGASAHAIGQEVGKTEKDIFTKDFARVEPPGVRLCQTPTEGGN